MRMKLSHYNPYRNAFEVPFVPVSTFGGPRRNLAAASFVHCPQQARSSIMIVATSSGGAGNVILAFLLGAVLLAVAIVGFFMWDNYKSGGMHAAAPPAVHVTVKK
jgi:hypothetical protein